MSRELELHRLAQEDLANIENWDAERRWYPKIMNALRTVAVGPKIAYSASPSGALKYQPIHFLQDLGVPAFHIVWEAELNGFRPMILDDGYDSLLTGIALHGCAHEIPGFAGEIDYDNPADPQIRRMIEIYEKEYKA